MVKPTRKNLRRIDTGAEEAGLAVSNIHKEVDRLREKSAKRRAAIEKSRHGGQQKTSDSPHPSESVATAGAFEVVLDTKGDSSRIHKSVKKNLDFSKTGKGLEPSKIESVKRFEKKLPTRTKAIAAIEQKRKKRNETFDLWGSAVAVPARSALPSLEAQFMSSDLNQKKKVFWNNKIIASVNRDPRKSSHNEAPALKIPHPGTSLNPTVEAQSAALQKSVVPELNRESEETTFNERLAPMTTLLEAKVDPALLKNFTEAEKQLALFLVRRGSEVTREAIEAQKAAGSFLVQRDDEEARQTFAVKVKYRTQAELNRKKRHMALLAEIAQRRRNMALDRQQVQHRLTQSLKELQKEKRKTYARRVYKETKLREEMKGVKSGDLTQIRMAGTIYNEKQMDVNTFGETTRGLRSLRTAKHGAAVFDRYDSFFMRGRVVNDYKNVRIGLRCSEAL
eukprot:GHVN01086061.1.p1 GENE.GHVN01086061.1~~GHVN01086061.1.p1  ORF type:complete len:450 (+),score=73.29 GHVN01086061.1:111-1460(+)